jgi:hypothetical protein
MTVCDLEYDEVLRMLKAVLKNIETNRECVTTSQAAEQSGLSRVYLARLLREETVEGFQLARDWFIYTDSLEQFLATPRKSGPKGPIKRTAQAKQQDTTQSA